MKNINKLILIALGCLFCTPLFAQNYYRPWQSYEPVKPQKPFEKLNTFSTRLQEKSCYYQGKYYEPNQIITELDIDNSEVFNFFRQCCSKHISKCSCNYIGTNNQTLLYTIVEKKAYRYMSWILNEGFVYDSYIDQWGTYINTNGVLAPLRNYNPMMLACKNGDMIAVTILRKRGAYLSKPVNDIGLTPYDFANKDADKKSKGFLEYIKQEYSEEIKNINDNKLYGKDFSEIRLQEFLNAFEKNFYENQQKIIEKVRQLNQI